jgi:Flp pilus assembly protein TadG
MKAAFPSLSPRRGLKIAGRKRLNDAMTFGKKLSALRRRMRKDGTRGSAAIEFAFVAPVFFGLLFGIMETGIMYFGQFALQNAVTQASRQIRTGQAQGTTASTTATCSGGSGGSGSGGAYANSGEWFKDQVCCGISSMLSCSNLHVNVQNYSGGFGASGAAFSNPQVGGLYVAATDSYSPGSACDVVLVRATYTWSVVTPVLSWFLVNMAGNAHLLASTTAFRNEPYGSVTC